MSRGKRKKSLLLFKKDPTVTVPFFFLLACLSLFPFFLQICFTVCENWRELQQPLVRGLLSVVWCVLCAIDLECLN